MYKEIKICGLSVVGGKSQKGFTLELKKGPSQRKAPYSLYCNNKLLARFDSEEKGRLYMDAFEKGYNFYSLIN